MVPYSTEHGVRFDPHVHVLQVAGAKLWCLHRKLQQSCLTWNSSTSRSDSLLAASCQTGVSFRPHQYVQTRCCKRNRACNLECCAGDGKRLQACCRICAHLKGAQARLVSHQGAVAGNGTAASVQCGLRIQESTHSDGGTARASMCFE